MRKRIPALIVVIAVAATLSVYSGLQDQIPVHWDFHGQANGWISRFWGAWLMPLVIAVLGVVLKGLPYIDPRRENYAKFAGAYEGMVILIMAYGLGVHFLLLAAGLGKPVSIAHWVPLGVGLLLAGLGILLPYARSNWFFGIRTPWTLSNDKVWDRTHRVGGPVMVVTGLLIAVGVLVVPESAQRIMPAAIAVMAFTLVAYSYLVWRQEVPPPGR